MKKFVYIMLKNKEIVFECFAENILNADKMFEEKGLGNPVKLSHIGCQIVSNDETTS
jgi:hypothetical protein